jgi:hypothetical protein
MHFGNCRLLALPNAKLYVALLSAISALKICQELEVLLPHSQHQLYVEASEEIH